MLGFSFDFFFFPCFVFLSLLMVSGGCVLLPSTLVESSLEIEEKDGYVSEGGLVKQIEMNMIQGLNYFWLSTSGNACQCDKMTLQLNS